jgi:two-component system, chemotaxis family, CheB/CheR fusion protein
MGSSGMTERLDQETNGSPEFDALLDYLKRTRSFDCSAYKRGSLMRRVQKRMQSVNIDSFVDYSDYLEVHPEEFAHLFNTILINVTSFFRDDTAWDYMRDEVLPRMLEAREDQPIRVWSAGCASGEEPYSIAMLLAEALGRDQFRDRVKIYATDLDDQTLNEARQASYSAKQAQTVPPPLLEKYFVHDTDRFIFDKEIRRSVIFGRHDLVQDAPISRVNLLICRNTLMYFDVEAQRRILARFHFALAEAGVLFLGKAEMLLMYSQLFAPVDLRRRIFRKIARDTWRDRMAIMNQAAGDEDFHTNGDRAVLVSAALDASPSAQVVIDGGGTLTMFNERARSILGLSQNDLGRPIQDLEMSYRPLEIRSLIDQSVEQRRPTTLRDVKWPSATRAAAFYDVHIVPLLDGARTIGISIALNDVSRAQELQVQLDQSKQDLETAYEELQSTNEELETTNEELQSTVEELETTNEELQSTNEELETMNEELQSTNEELQTINEELRERSEALNTANSFLESILTGVRGGVVVLDHEMRVVAWNHRAEDLWGLRDDEVKGQNFLNLDIGLPTHQLLPAIRTALNGDGRYGEITLTATNRRGKGISCKVTATPLRGAGPKARGVILMMDEQAGTIEH